MINLPHYWGGTSKMGPMTMKFELNRAFCTVHIPTKFHHHTFNHSEVTVWQTDRQTKKRFGKKCSPSSIMLCRWRINQPINQSITY